MFRVEMAEMTMADVERNISTFISNKNLFRNLKGKHKTAICILFQIETHSAKVGMWAEVQSVFIEYVN